MKPVKWMLPLLSMGVICCSQKPKPVIAQAPVQPSIGEAGSRPTGPDKTTEDRRLKIQELLAKAFQPVYFPYDQASLSKESKTLLAQAGDLLKQEPSINVLIQGNADERGTNEYNLALGEKRGQVVKEYLVSYGIEASRLNIISYGEEKPAKHGHDESAWALNRRDEFNVTF